MLQEMKLWMVLVAVVLGAGCIRVRTEVEPIDINVNVRLQVDRELSDFFSDLDARNPTLQPRSETP